MTSKVIGIVGSRRRASEDDYAQVAKALNDIYERGDTICSGLCPRGADMFAVRLAKVLEAPTLWFPADWSKHGKRAGIMRNTDIAKHSDILIACVAPDRTGGTEDTICKFIRFHGEDGLIILEVDNDA